MYAAKDKIVSMVRSHGVCIVKGGTGTGKTVCVPQWTYDNLFFATGKPNGRIAVLVPRRAIAEGLATYLCGVRRVTLGGEIGVGVSGNVHLSETTRLLFCTTGVILRRLQES